MLAIDNGIDGAIAVLDFDTKQALELHDMPHRSTEWGLREIDPTMLRILLDGLKERYEIVRATIERLTKQGGKSGKMGFTAMLSMGSSQGIVLAVLEMLAISINWIRSEEWKPRIVGSKAPKNASLTVARQKFANMAGSLMRVKDHNRAEALLIGAYDLG